MTPSEIQEAARLAFLEAGVEIPDEWDIRYRPLQDEPGLRGCVGLWDGPRGASKPRGFALVGDDFSIRVLTSARFGLDTGIEEA